MDPESKTLALELNADGDAEGSFSATFSTLNVVDHHGDVTLPGAFEPGKEVLIGGYQHDMMSLPVGKATIRADEERAWVDGAFFLDTRPGEDAYRTVKNAGGLMEWSYVFRVTDSDWGDFDTGKGIVEVRYIKAVDVWSVDPVLKGAGIGTRTDSIKGLPLPFGEQADALVTAVGLFVKRAESRLEMRARDGRSLSADDRAQLDALVTGLDGLKARLEEALREKATEPIVDLHHEFLSFQRAEARASGLVVPA
ncbi:MAG: HK97 family phage prohead protease [Desulfuromonadales bacterium]